MRRPVNWCALVWLLGDGFAVLGGWRAGAEEVAVAVDVVDAVDGRPVLVGAARGGREAALGAGVRAVPDVVGDVVDGVGGEAEGVSVAASSPDSMSAISERMAIMASQKRSISALDSDSVGSIIRVPATGKLMVGAWKP